MSVTTLSARPPLALTLRDNSAETVRGIVLLSLCYLLMSFSDVAVKYALPLAGVAGALLARGTVGAATVAVLAFRSGPANSGLTRSGLARLRPVRVGPVLVRAALQSLNSVTWYAAFRSMTLADAYAVSFTTPLIATTAAVLLLGERLDLRRILATVAGFAGVLIILRPGGNLWSTDLAILLSGVICSALARILTRGLSTSETPESLSFSMLLMHIPVGLAMLWLYPPPALSLSALLPLLAIGILGGITQIMNARAYALAPVSALGPFDYGSLLWALLLGWFCFGEMPHAAAVQGAVVIAAAGLYSLRSEQRRHRRARGTA